jgi:hypothetical protein
VGLLEESLMPRPSKLSPAQWDQIAQRLAGGEVLRDLAKEYGVSPAAISKRAFTKQSKRVQETAQKVAEAQTALAAHPVHEQYTVLNLAAKLRSISDSMASGAELGAKNFHRLNFMANSELQKVDDADPMADEKSIAALKNAAVLTKMANEAASTPINLLAANKDRVNRMGEPEDDDQTQQGGVLVVPGLSTSAEEWSANARTRGAKE